jgi:SAM-dependent methyltransferase
MILFSYVPAKEDRGKSAVSLFMGLSMYGIDRVRRHDRQADGRVGDTIAGIYNRAGSAYVAYADGDPEQLFDFEGPHGYADRRLWSVLDGMLTALRDQGAEAVRILDAGCGPGTWLRRLVTRARALGFTRIAARGFDVAEAQIDTARRMAHELARQPCVDLTFDVADLTRPLPEADGATDLTLCLYSVLSHLPAASRPAVVAELARVTRGHFVATVRSVGSTPSIFVDAVEKARDFQYDHARDLCRVELLDGRRFALRFHLFTAAEFRDCFADRFAIEDLCGLDLFHSRFVPDPRWNPLSPASDRASQDHLDRLEDAYARTPGLMEHANHLLLIGRPAGAKVLAEVAEPRG